MFPALISRRYIFVVMIFCCWCVWCVKCSADCWWDKHIHCLLMCDSHSHVRYRILQTCTPRRKVVVCIVEVIIHHFCRFQPLKLFNPAGLAHAYSYRRIDTRCIFYRFFFIAGTLVTVYRVQCVLCTRDTSLGCWCLNWNPLYHKLKFYITSLTATTK